MMLVSNISAVVFFSSTVYVPHTRGGRFKELIKWGYFLLFSLSLKLNTKITLDHPPTHHPPTTNFSKGSRLSRRLRFEMKALLRLIY